MLLLLRVPEDVLKLLKLCIVMELWVVLLLKGALLHKVQGPIGVSTRSGDRGPVLLLMMDPFNLFTHLVKLEKVLRSTALLGLQELLRELGSSLKENGLGRGRKSECPFFFFFYLWLDPIGC